MGRRYAVCVHFLGTTSSFFSFETATRIKREPCRLALAFGMVPDTLKNQMMVNRLFILLVFQSISFNFPNMFSPLLFVQQVTGFKVSRS